MKISATDNACEAVRGLNLIRIISFITTFTDRHFWQNCCLSFQSNIQKVLNYHLECIRNCYLTAKSYASVHTSILFPPASSQQLHASLQTSEATQTLKTLSEGRGIWEMSQHLRENIRMFQKVLEKFKES